MITIDKQLLDEMSRQAKKSPHMRKNYNFHQSLDEKRYNYDSWFMIRVIVAIYFGNKNLKDGCISNSYIYKNPIAESVQI